MNDENTGRVTLATVCSGELPGIFEEQYRKVMKDITDDCKKMKAPRRISLHIEIAPNESGKHVAIKAWGEAKLAPPIPVEAMAVIMDGIDGPELSESAQQRQLSFDDIPEDVNIITMKREN